MKNKPLDLYSPLSSCALIATALFIFSCAGSTGAGNVATLQNPPANCSFGEGCCDPTDGHFLPKPGCGALQTSKDNTPEIAAALKAASAAQKAAESTVSSAPTIGSSQKAASAADKPLADSTHDVDPGNAASALKALSNRSGGGSAGAASGGAGFVSLGDPSTAAAAAPQGSIMAMNGVPGSGYSAGKGGRRGGAGGMSALFGGDSGGLPNGAPARADFRGSVDPSLRQPAQGSLDPEDYFTRVDSKEDIFKVVERRYQKTSMGWASLTARNAIDAMGAAQPTLIQADKK